MESQKFNISEEDYESDSSVIEISDFEEINDGASVVSSEDEDTEAEESSGFFSDEDDQHLNDNLNRRKRPSEDREVVLRGRCALCTNLETLRDSDLEERCQHPSAELWCKCGKCEVVSYHMKKYDRICCHELSGVVNFLDSVYPESLNCITDHPQFIEEVLQYGALYKSSTQHLHFEKFRKQGGKDDREKAMSANWAFVMWIWGEMSHSYRIMPPACVISKIRQVHMKNAPFWYYQNFMPGKFRCDHGNHCVAAANDTANIK